MQYKNKETIEEEFAKNYIMKNFALYNKEKDIPATTTEMIYIIHQIIQEDLNAIKEMIENFREMYEPAYEESSIYLVEQLNLLLQNLDNLNK